MPASVTLHTRPVFASHTDVEVLAATENVLLIREGDSDFSLLLADLDEGFTRLLKMPTWMANGKHFSFYDDFTLFFINIRSSEREFTCIHLTKDFVNDPEKKFIVHIMPPGIIRAAQVVDGHNILVTSYMIGKMEILEVYKSDQLDWHLEDCNPCWARLVQINLGENAALVDVCSDGILLVARIAETRGWKRVDYSNIVHDIDKDTFPIDKKDGLRHPSICATESGALFWKREGSTLSLSVVQSDVNKHEYRAFIPLSEDEIYRFSFPSAFDEQFNVITVGRRFFYNINNVIMTGSLPGTDVSLEEMATAAAWRNLPPSAQNDMLSRCQISKRAILLCAILEEDREAAERAGLQFKPSWLISVNDVFVI